MEKNINDSTLLNIALIMSFIGIFTLFIMMYWNVIPERTISNISISDSNKIIGIKGYVKDIRYSQNNRTTFLVISQECLIDVVAFQYLNLTQEDFVEIKGKVQLSQDTRSIVADSIRTLNILYNTTGK